MAQSMSTRSETEALHDTAISTVDLLGRFMSVLNTGSNTVPTKPANDRPNPLDILHTAATLLTAHTTKLSLLLVNKPFTPSAIRKVISEAAGTCLPAMVSAVEMCKPEDYGCVMHEEVRLRVRRVFLGVEVLLQEVLSQTSTAKVGEKCPTRETLASTGVVWQACDSLMELKSMGLAGLLVKKAQEYRATLEDAISELKEWAEDDEEDDGDDDEDEPSELETMTRSLADSAFEDSSDAANGMEAIFEAANKLPKGRVDLKATLDKTFKKLRLVSTLFQAVIKRRLKTLPPVVDPAIYKRVDSAMAELKHLPEQSDELAGSFYELDNHEAQQDLAKLANMAARLVEVLSKDWKQEEDEFTAWSAKWLTAWGS